MEKQELATVVKQVKLMKFYYYILLVVLSIALGCDKSPPVKCRLVWTNTATAYGGHGDWFSIKEEAVLRAYVETNRITHPELNHWLEYK